MATPSLDNNSQVKNNLCKSTGDPEDIFCQECRVLVCKKCVTSQHVDHLTRNLSAKAVEINSKLIAILENVKVDGDTHKLAGDSGNWRWDWENKIDMYGQQKTNKIKEKANEVKKQIDAAVKGYLAVVTNVTDTPKKMIRAASPLNSFESNKQYIKNEIPRLLETLKGNDYKEYEEFNKKYQSVVSKHIEYAKHKVTFENSLKIRQEIDEKFKTAFPATQILTLKNINTFFQQFHEKIVSRTEITKCREERRLVEKSAKGCI